MTTDTDLILQRLDRIEGKVDSVAAHVQTITDALVEDIGAPQQHTLEGEDVGAERDQGLSLDTEG